MTWQERVNGLMEEGKFAKASDVFAFSVPNSSYVQKMQFGDKMYRYKAFHEATYWYEECIGTPVEQDYYYLTETGCKETDLDETSSFVGIAGKVCKAKAVLPTWAT